MVILALERGRALSCDYRKSSSSSSSSLNLSRMTHDWLVIYFYMFISNSN